MDAKHYSRVWQGRRNKFAGNHFETIIESASVYYKTRGVAVIKKTPEPMKPIKDLGQGKFVAYYEKKAQPDFKGTLKGGRTVIFDAKHTDTDRIQRSVISDEQEKDLDAHEELGALCFVLVSFGFQQFYRIPWQTFKAMKQIYGRMYAKPEELEKFKIHYTGGVLKFLE